MRAKFLLVALLLLTSSAVKSQQRSAEAQYRHDFELAVYMMSHAKSEGFYVAAIMIGKMDEDKARKIADVMLEHNVKYEVQCHMGSLQEFSLEIREAAYQKMKDGGHYEDLAGALSVLWTPLVDKVDNRDKTYMFEYFRMRDAAEKYRKECMKESFSELEAKLYELDSIK